MLIALDGKAEQVFLHVKQYLQSSRQPSRPRRQLHRSLLCRGSTPCRLTCTQCYSRVRCSCRGAWRGTRPAPRPGLSAKPPTPCVRKRCTHLYTKRRLIPTVAAMVAIGTPSATSKMILPRLARPAEMVVARCHASSVRRSAGVRVILRAVLRPRAIVRPCVREGSVVVSSRASTPHTARHGSTTPGAGEALPRTAPLDAEAGASCGAHAAVSPRRIA